MSEFLKIKLQIADRLYPMTVKSSQEESLRKTARKIGEQIKKLEENYSVRDKQDVLAMCVIQFASQVEQQQANLDLQEQYVNQQFSQLNSLIEESLSGL